MADETFMTIKYNRSLAVDYAIRYAIFYNPDYADLSTASGNGQGDCANFVSQVLRAGGWPMDGGFVKWPWDWWYERKPDHVGDSGWASSSWVKPGHLRTYIALSGRGAECSEQDLLPGDVVFVVNNVVGAVFHAMVVTSVLGKNDVGVTYHTTNVLNCSFRKTKEKFGKDCSYLPFKIADARVPNAEYGID